MQACSSAGLTHSTLKVYVAALSAYRAPLGGQSVGRHLQDTGFLQRFALAVLHSHWAWICQSSGVGISFSWHPRTQLEFPKRNVLGYICNPSSLSERDAASRCHTFGIPASACFIPEADTGFTACAFMLSGHYVTRPGRLAHSLDRLYLYPSAVTLETLPSVLGRSVSFPQGIGVTYVHLHLCI